MTYTLAEKVRADIDRRAEEDRGTGEWLNRAIPFERSLRLNGNQKEKLNSILVLCGVSRRKENYINL